MKLLDRHTYKVIFEDKRCKNLPKLIKLAINQDADLRDADLRGADLEGANLRGANLRGASLRYANLENTCIISFSLGKHFSYYQPSNKYLRIGCLGESLEEWVTQFKGIGEKNDYSREEIELYGAMINLLNEKVGA